MFVVVITEICVRIPKMWNAVNYFVMKTQVDINNYYYTELFKTNTRVILVST